MTTTSESNGTPRPDTPKQASSIIQVGGGTSPTPAHRHRPRAFVERGHVIERVKRTATIKLSEATWVDIMDLVDSYATITKIDQRYALAERVLAEIRQEFGIRPR